jgi:tetratricopeptide (TPR) repeat protein
MRDMDAPKSLETSPGVESRAMPSWLPWVALPLLIAAACQQVLHAGFIWDDDVHLTENPCVVGPLGFWDIWTSSHARICPLVISSFWLQHKLWGLHPLPYHLMNVAMHAAGALALWRALRALNVRGAWLGAALWALHPVQVESVAWITELKNTQSGLFFALTVLFFVRWLKGGANPARRRWEYGLMILFAALAMASKSSTVVLPAILALCAWWVEGRCNWRTIARLWPVLALALAASALSLWTQDLEGANESGWRRGFAERMATAGCVVWFYLGKLLWPYPLIFIYPRWVVDPARIVTWLPALSAIVALAFLWWRRNGVLRPIFLAAACFAVALFPVLGLLNHYFLRYSLVGDHFQYLASMAPLALAGAGIAALPGLFKRWRHVAALSGGLLLAVLCMMTWRRVSVYENSTTLWKDTVARNPDAWMAWNNLGAESLARSDPALAITFCRRALEIFPSHSKTHNNLGLALLQTGNRDEAIAEFREAIHLTPRHVDAHNNLAVALLQDGRIDEAIESCRQVISLRPLSPDAYTNMGNALLLQGHTDEAIKAWEDALRADPHYAEAHINLCVAMLQANRPDEAFAHGEMAVSLNPESATAHSALASALRLAGRLEEAVTQFRSSIRLNPANGATHNNLANVLRETGQLAEAVPHYKKAAELLPESIPVLNNFAWALATCPDAQARNGPRAIEVSQRAMTLLGGENPSLMRTLAAGYAADGKFDKAQETAQRALNLNGTDGDAALAAALREDLELYRLGRPLIEQSPVRQP